MDRFVLVATDGSPASMGALRVAGSLAAKKGTGVQVLGVVEPVPIFDAGFMVALPEVELYESRRDALRNAIEKQVEEITGARDGWPIRVEAGLPGTTIVRQAEEAGAGAILMGLGRHRPVDRMFGTETVLQVVRVSHLPVLAVPQDFDGLPRSAAFAVDFSVFSQRAGRAALSLMDSPWEAHLVHVMSGMEFLPSMSDTWRKDYEEELRARLSELARGFEATGADRVSFHLLEGEPSHELLAFATSSQVQLLAAGSHGHSFVGRLLMGSVSARLIRGADIPVLVVPPPDPTAEAAGDPAAKGTKASWVDTLRAFTRDNAGRRTTLEVDDPLLGKQQCGLDLLLRGVDYDPREDRIDIMLGPFGSVEGHLTHSIPRPVDISIDQDEKGNAQALHVEVPKGAFSLRIQRG